jgi:hypothetical protein
MPRVLVRGGRGHGAPPRPRLPRRRVRAADQAAGPGGQRGDRGRQTRDRHGGGARPRRRLGRGLGRGLGVLGVPVERGHRRRRPRGLGCHGAPGGGAGRQRGGREAARGGGGGSGGGGGRDGGEGRRELRGRVWARREQPQLTMVTCMPAFIGTTEY